METESLKNLKQCSPPLRRPTANFLLYLAKVFAIIAGEIKTFCGLNILKKNVQVKEQNQTKPLNNTRSKTMNGGEE